MENNIKKYSVAEINDFFRSKDQIAAYFDMTVEEASETHSVISMPLEAKHKNGINTVHGGATFSLADIAFGAACAGAGVYCVNAQTSLSYLNLGTEEPIRAKATLLKTGKKMRVYAVEVHDNKKVLMAHGTITGYCIGNLQDII